MYYSVCVPAVFRGVPTPEALYKIRDCGAEAFEMWGWWDQDMDAIVRAQQETGLKAAAICTKGGPLTDAFCIDAYIEGLRESIAVAKRLNCPTLISQAGDEIPGLTRESQHNAIVEGLKRCAPILEEAGITLVLEPLNTLVDHKGYFLWSSHKGFDIVKSVGSKNVKLLYDVYHQQIMEGNLIANICQNIDLIGHFHIAAVPGRGDPLSRNEINYPAVLEALKNTGYTGAVGLEYFITEDPSLSVRNFLTQMAFA